MRRLRKPLTAAARDGKIETQTVGAWSELSATFQLHKYFLSFYPISIFLTSVASYTYGGESQVINFISGPSKITSITD